METLDSLLESIAFENFTTNIHVAGLLNGNVNDSNANQSILTTTNNHEINRKTDALNRYFDNLINFNREYEKHHSRKSDSPSDQSSELSDQQINNVRRPPQVTFFLIFTINIANFLSPSFTVNVSQFIHHLILKYIIFGFEPFPCLFP